MVRSYSLRIDFVTILKTHIEAMKDDGWLRMLFYRWYLKTNLLVGKGIVGLHMDSHRHNNIQVDISRG